MIDGSELSTDRMSGITRYAYEIVRELDGKLDNGIQELDLTLCYPEGKDFFIPDLKRIKTIGLPTEGKAFRANILRHYAKKNKCPVCSFGPSIPFSHRAIITIHDIRPLATDQYDGKGLKRYFQIALLLCRVFRCRIVTVSEFQKKEIVRIGHIQPSKVIVIGNGWDHIKRIDSDEGIFQRFPEILKEKYFYSLGSLAKHKNIEWIYEAAKRNPQKQFVVAGNISKEKWGIGSDGFEADNIIFTGYISDEENKALLEHCAAFIHPSKYEGFGIPPMEALALNKKALVSNSTCLPEIYEGYASLFDPDDYDVDIDQLLNEEHKSPEELLNRFTWNHLAEKWLQLLKE